MPSSLLKYHRNNIGSGSDDDASTRTITAFYSFRGGSSRRHTAYASAYAPTNSSSYVLFVASSKNIYIETQQVSIRNTIRRPQEIPQTICVLHHISTINTY
uniref:Uncharacterized protein n=1 Tax=viral metagenome TaxID=1070528 RepID=A0A6C0KBG0_9ZZZZ